MKDHRCDMEDGTRCKYHDYTSPPDRDDLCCLYGCHSISNWWKSRSTFPKKCPFRMEDGFRMKILIDRTLKIRNKKPFGVIKWLKID